MGSGFWLGLLFLVLHLALCGALWLLARSRALEVEGYFLPVALLVPLWGPLCVVLLHTSHRLTGGQLLDQTLEKLRINEEIYKNILVAENEEEDTVVPLEEAPSCLAALTSRSCSSSGTEMTCRPFSPMRLVSRGRFASSA